MSAPGFCPCCGYNFREDEIVERDGFTIDPRAASVIYHGRKLQMAASPARIMHALAASDRAVLREALLARVSGSEDMNTLAVQVHRARKACEDVGAPCPIFTQQGVGYIWQVAA
ncbi:winged helix-turn-helix domain-containing protein [Novosphingobium sp.]|uniref:winged helix-turn-helix domain-containing protein n=1 Tax=Novosphingobium sp. TaxID=1874826 RepID=UPI00261433AE|nr:winged helix-turn-helix domain-containing protein [Novosphingobium sp.]